MADGGFRPAYNAQYYTDSESRVIAGADVVTVGSGQGQMAPMMEQGSERCGKSPEEWLVDGGPGYGQIDAVAEQTTAYAPVPTPKDKARPPYPEAGGQRSGRRMAGSHGC